ncbi:hypothetical protein CRI94_13195 [Longibacter salinarum]|uniref:Uncharacterized protein n=1 Tax=Longibacter salinarum TaxID=1850348 RepID=A0A2A8CW22_9BACT|nr:hypothetical protein [Longibacter salinarum]PEN12949.1 hypothetical protein CRI94_13195 [Longibacter salinarum]
MRQPDVPSRDDWMDERVEAFVDGDLTGDEYATFTSILEDDTYWQTQVRQAERIRERLHELPEKPCPSDVTHAIFERTSRAHASHVALPWWKDLLRQAMQAWRALMTAHRRPVVDYAVGVALVGIAVFFIVNPLEDPANQGPTATNVSSTFNTAAPIQAPYSEADVQRATQRAYRAFDYISNAGKRASSVVHDEMQQAASPASQSGASASSDSGSASSADGTEMKIANEPDSSPDPHEGVRSSATDR